MKILYTIGRYWPTVGGGELHTRELVKHVTRRNRAMVACLRNDNSTDWLYGMTTNPQRKQRPYFDNQAEVHVIRLGLISRIRARKKLEGYYSSEERRISCNRMLAGIYAEELAKLDDSFDLVHSIKIGEEFFSLASLSFAREKNIPFVFTPISHPVIGWRGELFSHLYRHADALIALTEAEKAFLVSQGAREERVFIAGAGPILKSLSPTEDIKSRYGIEGPAVLFLGQKYPHKGVAQLLEAAPLVWARYPEAHFVFAGPRTLHSRGLFSTQRDKRIIEIGTLSDDEKPNLLAGCDVFCMPSIGESFGMVYLEAWSFRKPVIAADTEASRCLIEDGRNGLLVKQEPRSIAEAVCTLIADVDLRNTLGRNGYEKVAACYSWGKIASAVEEVYQKAVENRLL